jgi:hypothetical protein
MVKTIVWSLFFIFVLIAGYLLTHIDKGPDSVLKNLATHYSLGKDGTIEDLMGEIGVNSINDIGFKKEKNKIEVSYGKNVFNVDLKKEDKQVVAYLKALGLSLIMDKEGNVQLNYKGELVKKFE